jgi:hypothetical protein
MRIDRSNDPRPRGWTGVRDLDGGTGPSGPTSFDPEPGRRQPRRRNPANPGPDHPPDPSDPQPEPPPPREEECDP